MVCSLAYRAEWSRTELNHRFLGVGQASWPLDHGTVFLKWSHRESHPDLQLAELASSCWTMAEAVRLELTNGTGRHLFSRQVPHPAG